MEEITLGQLLQAVNGTLLGPFQNPSAIMQKVDTDSRNMHPGSLFIPLVGDRFDGHAYINAALESGAVGCLTARERESYREDKFYVKVANTQRALRDLAAWYKSRFDIPFVAVTGSVGKTTAKDMIAAVLGTRFRVLKTEGNFNNNIGLPLTILRLDRTVQVCVLEMGMDRPGEIDYLADIVRPNVGVITNIGDAHIERLGSRENIFKAKCELLPHIRPGGLVGLNYYRYFIKEDGISKDIDDLLAHVRHFLSLGGEDILCCGSDFDGAEIPNYLNGLDRVENFRQALLDSGISPEITQKILFENARRFFEKNL